MLDKTKILTKMPRRHFKIQQINFMTFFNDCTKERSGTAEYEYLLRNCQSRCFWYRNFKIQGVQFENYHAILARYGGFWISKILKGVLCSKFTKNVLEHSVVFLIRVSGSGTLYIFPDCTTFIWEPICCFYLI